MRVLSVKKTGLGTPALGGTCASSMTIVDNGVGDYSLIPNENFEQIPEVIVVPTTAEVVLQIGTVAVDEIQILAFDLADGTTPAEANFHALIIGSDALDLL